MLMYIGSLSKVVFYSKFLLSDWLKILTIHQFFESKYRKAKLSASKKTVKAVFQQNPVPPDTYTLLLRDQKLKFFHKNHMLVTLDFTDSKQLFPFQFFLVQPLNTDVFVVVALGGEKQRPEICFCSQAKPCIVL